MLRHVSNYPRSRRDARLRGEGLTLCWPGETDNESLSSEQNVQTDLDTLHTIIPQPNQFNSSFTNPCWYTHITVPTHLRRLLWKKDITDSEASHVLSQIFNAAESAPKKLMCIPKIFIVGFPRSGSTQLYNLLLKHTEVVGGVYKEPNWWARAPYRGRFPHSVISMLRYIRNYRIATGSIQRNPRMLTVDASQSTIWDRRNSCAIPNVLYSVIPQAKYIVLMREPVNRLFSDYTYHCKNGRRGENGDFAGDSSQLLFQEAVLQEAESFVQCSDNNTVEVCAQNTLIHARSVAKHKNLLCGRVHLGISLYHVHISRWLKIIPRDRFLFLRMEDLVSNTYHVLRNVWEFLELPMQSETDFSSNFYEESNSNFDQLLKVRLDPVARNTLEQFFQFHNEKLARLLSDDRFLWKGFL